MNSFSIVQKLYLSIYDRPADWAGLRFWSDRLETQGMAGVFKAFTDTPEFAEAYTDLLALGRKDATKAMYDPAALAQMTKGAEAEPRQHGRQR
jgi:hypothetical protein